MGMTTVSYSLYSSYVGLSKEQVAWLSANYSSFIYKGYLGLLSRDDSYFDLLRYYLFISSEIDVVSLNKIVSSLDLSLTGSSMSVSDIDSFLSSVTDDINCCKFNEGDLVSVRGYQNCVFRLMSLIGNEANLSMCLKDIVYDISAPVSSLVDPSFDLEYVRDTVVHKGVILFDVGYVLSRVRNDFDFFLRFLFKYKTIFMNYTTVFYVCDSVVLPDWWIDFISLLPVPVVNVVFNCDIFVSNRRYFLRDLVVITEDSSGVLPFELDSRSLEFERVYSALSFVTSNRIDRDSLLGDYNVYGLDYLLNERLSRFKDRIVILLNYQLENKSFDSLVDVSIKDFSKFCYSMNSLWIFNNFMSNVSRLVR